MPTGAFVTPAANASVNAGESVGIEITASDPAGIASVMFYVNPQYGDLGNGGNDSHLWTDITSPYTTAWDTTGLADGEYSLVAIITNTIGESLTIYRAVVVGEPIVSSGPKKLEWDKVGDRRYETGIDRGVLYLIDGSAVPWNGLIGVNEIVSRETKPFYIDGVKFLDYMVPGSYAAKLSAYTYPDEMDELTGTKEFSPGVFLHDQPSSELFNLSYRTLVGNDAEGIDHGYKIHVIYNVMGVLNDTSLGTIGESVSAQAFEWTLFGTPIQAAGIRPTCHISLDSRRIDPAMLAMLEERLYGSVSVDPDLPTLSELMVLATP